MQNLDRARAKRILAIQVVLAVIVSGGAYAIRQEVFLSAFIGGGIAALGNATFAWLVFGRYRAQEPGRLVTRFYGAELAKLLLVISGFAAAFIWLRPLSPVALLGAFFVVQVLPPVLAHLARD